MKRILSTIAVLLVLWGVRAQEKNSISAVLRQIEQNNKELLAGKQTAEAQKLENRTSNNLADPSVSYAHTWHGQETIGELVVSQSFDFPSLYVTRNRLNRLKALAADGQTEVLRQTVLLQAKQACLDLIMLRQQQEILGERLRNAEDLAALYQKRLQKGDANAMEMNKIKLELLNARTECSNNQASLEAKEQELQSLNGNIPVDFPDASYPPVPFPSDYQKLKAEVMAADKSLQGLAREHAAALKQVTVNKSGWLPKLELGYRRNSESGMPFNGLVVGFSIPLFENRNKVKQARIQAAGTAFQRSNAEIQVEATLSRLYNQARSLHTSMEEYKEAFAGGQDLKLLKQALEGGQISMIEYFVEVSVIYQSKQNYLQLENQYQKAMAEIYKNEL